MEAVDQVTPQIIRHDDRARRQPARQNRRGIVRPSEEAAFRVEPAVRRDDSRARPAGERFGGQKLKVGSAYRRKGDIRQVGLQKLGER